MAALKLLPAPRTALEFVAEGVHFRWSGGIVKALGRPGGEDLQRALRDEVLRRVALIMPQIPATGFVPRIAIALVPVHARVGSCDGCGDPMKPYRGGMCELCSLALQRALRDTGRLPS